MQIVAALIREPEGAALVVVPSRARGAARGRFFSLVSRGVARLARCPVVVRTEGHGGRARRIRATHRPTWHGPPGIAPVHRPGTPWE
jgi:Universal stress protein family